ncbi:helix-turn-helix domain-containing protein [Chloroflexota bacterium]
MPVTIKGITYYRTAEVCQLVGIGRSTLLRWLRDGVINGPPRRDRRGWRLFSEDDVKTIENEVNHIKQPVNLAG